MYLELYIVLNFGRTMVWNINYNKDLRLNRMLIDNYKT